jgi:hypothetical protein
MTPDGTNPTPRVGETITTAAELDALPVGSVVLDPHGRAFQKRPTFGPEGAAWFATASTEGHSVCARPARVLFRPDAPQPAPADDDAVERAVLAACAEAGWDWEAEPGVPTPMEAMRPIVVAALSLVMPHPAESQWQSATFYGEPNGGWVISPEESRARVEAFIASWASQSHAPDRIAFTPAEADGGDGVVLTLRDLRAALAAARAGEAEHVCTVHCEQGHGHYPAPAQRGGEAADREVLALARNIVNQVLDGAVGQGGYRLVDMKARQRFNDVADRFVADLLAARGGTAPTLADAWDEGYAFLAEQGGGVHDGETHNPYRREVQP